MANSTAATGGADPWPADRYLNLWVCNLAGGLLGYAQFPGGPARTDGVVITYTAFGTRGTAAAPLVDERSRQATTSGMITCRCPMRVSRQARSKSSPYQK